jgi:hypothetical protein
MLLLRSLLLADILSDLLFMETSALTGECVDEVFIKCTTAIMNKIESGAIDMGNAATPKETTDATLSAAASGRCAC